MDAYRASAAEHAARLAALQYGDSFFPGGGIALSWGLEQLRGDGEIATPEDVAAFIEGQLVHRWATFDVPALCAAWRSRNLDELCALDARVEAMTLARELREGSRRAGGALLTVHARLAMPEAQAYRNRVLEGAAPGHLAPVQGLVWRYAGLDEAACRAVSAHLTASGMVSAALRLGLLGHLQAQEILTGLRPLVAGLLAQPVGTFEEAAACTPSAEVAAMRHELADCRMFAN